MERVKSHPRASSPALTVDHFQQGPSVKISGSEGLSKLVRSHSWQEPAPGFKADVLTSGDCGNPSLPYCFPLINKNNKN